MPLHLLRSTALAACLFAAAPAARAVEVQVPPDTVACSFSAWSNDKDPAGLNVRAAPDPKAPVLGRYKIRKNDYGSKVEFEVIGYKNGWFLIDKAGYGEYDDKRAPAVYSGQGWVHGSKIGGQLVGLHGPLRDQPDAEAGKDITDEAMVDAVLACKGSMVQIKSDVGTGWVHGLCSNQVTTCP